MSNITIIGVDLAKNIFQLHAEDQAGQVVFRKRLKRAAFKRELSKHRGCLIGMEACATAHYWGRVCLALGHQVKLMNPKRVKAFLGTNKNDARDAEAICEAARSRKVHTVAVKTQPQQELSTLHKGRCQVVNRRTQVLNHMRSQLAEYGMITTPGKCALMRRTQEVLASEQPVFSEIVSFTLRDHYEEVIHLDKRIKAYDRQVRQVLKTHKQALTLQAMPGIGPLTATAIVAKVSDVGEFKNGRNFAAWLGLTPKENASAQRRRLGRISKHGDRYIRTLLIHGARSVMLSLKKNHRPPTAYSRWIRNAIDRLGWNKAAVALANKHARMIWAILYHGREYDGYFAEKQLKQVA